MTAESRGAERTSPEAGAARRLEELPECPFCGARETKVVSAFGSHASLAAYWCERCRSPFESLRWRAG